MDILFFLIPISLLLLLLIVGALLWAIKSGQFDDLDRMGQEILFEDDRLDEQQRAKPDEKGNSR